MYNISVLDLPEEEIFRKFGDKYEKADEIELPNAIVTDGSPISTLMMSSKLLFAVTDLSDSDKGNIPLDQCSFSGICIFRSEDQDLTIEATKDFIENGNIRSSVNLPDVTLGPFGDDVSRISVVMHRIDDPILMAAMMFSGLDIRAIAGGCKGDYSYALIAAREPVTAVPKVDSILKVRVLQDI